MGTFHSKFLQPFNGLSPSLSPSVRPHWATFRRLGNTLTMLGAIIWAKTSLTHTGQPILPFTKGHVSIQTTRLAFGPFFEFLATLGSNNLATLPPTFVDPDFEFSKTDSPFRERARRTFISLFTLLYSFPREKKSFGK